MNIRFAILVSLLFCFQGFMLLAQPTFVNEAPTDCNTVAFNNIRDDNTTPLFALQGTLGTTTDIEIELNTASDFSGTAYTEIITGTFDANYTVQTTNALGLPITNNVVYFVRVRESKDNQGSWSPWSVQTWAYTYSTDAPGYNFTTRPQFEQGTPVAENYGNFISQNGTWLPTDFIGLDEGSFSFNARTTDGVYENGVWYPNVSYQTIGWQNNCNGNAKIWNGFPFQVFIPQGASLNTVDFSVVSTTSCVCESQSVGMRFDVTAMAEDDAPVLNGTNVRATTGLTTIEKLNYTTAWANNTRYTMTDVSAILQEIIDRPGWSSGNDFNLLFRWDDAFAPAANNNRCIRQADNGATTAPRIEGTFSNFSNSILFEDISRLAFGPCTQWESLITTDNVAGCGTCGVNYIVYEGGTANIVASGTGTIDLSAIDLDVLDLEIQLTRDTDTPEVLSFVFTTTNDTEVPAITGTLTTLEEDGCGVADASAAVTTVAELEAMGVAISDNCTADVDLEVTFADVESGSCPVVVTRTYTVTDLCGNTSTVDQTINLNDTEAPTASNPVGINVNCASDVPSEDVTVVIDEADNCDPAPIVTFVSDVSDNNTCAGEIITRTYRITDACNNTVDVEQLITIDAQNPTFTLAGTNPTVCGQSDGSITISGLLPATDYDLTYAGNATVTVTSDGAGSYEITGLPAGVYDNFELVLTDCPTCVGEDAVGVTLVDPDAPDFSVDIINGPTTCGGNDGSILINGAATLTPNTDYELTYSIDGVVVGPAIITTDVNGNYEIANLEEAVYSNFILDFDFGGCETTFAGPINLDDPEAPNFTVELGNDPTTCGGNDGMILINGSGTLLPSTDYELTYSANGATVGPTTITTDGSGNYEIGGLTEGEYENFSLVINACETVLADRITLTDPTPPIADPSTSTPDICEGENILLEATTVVGATYTWTGPNSFTSGDQNPVITAAEPVEGGTYTLIVTTNNCPSTPVDVSVVVNELPELQITDPDLVCAPATVDLTAPAITDGSNNATNLTYWLDAGATQAVVDPTQLTNSGTYYVQADNNGCTTIAAVEVEVVDEVTYTVTGIDPSACGLSDGQFVIEGLNPNEDYIIVYNEGAVVFDPVEATSDGSGQIEISNLTEGNYEVVVALATSGCAGELLDVELVAPEGPTVSPMSAVEACDSYVLPTISGTSLSGNQSYYSLPGGPMGGGDEYEEGTEISMTTTLYAYDISGNCSSEEELVITITETPDPVVVTSDALLCFGDVSEGVEVTAAQGDVEWYSDAGLTDFYQSGDIIVPVDEIGQQVYYGVAVVNDCESETLELTIDVVACEFEFPTAFTPNSDGINDVWELPNLDLLYPNNTVQVYSRWGALLFEHDSAQNGPYNLSPWDGTHNGELLPQGSYLFIISFNNGSEEGVNGAVSILLE